MDPTSDGSSSDGSSNVAGAIAQIFSTGVTAYVDSQAIQRGYTINNPQYYQSGYPGGVGLPYGSAAAGQGLTAPAGLAVGGSGMILLLGLVVVAVVLIAK